MTWGAILVVCFTTITNPQCVTYKVMPDEEPVWLSREDCDAGLADHVNKQMEKLKTRLRAHWVCFPKDELDGIGIDQ